MNDVADHEARFHDHGEMVDEPYPQQSEGPLRTGVAKITATGGDGTYTITEVTWTGSAWDCGTAPGQYVTAAARDLNDSTDGSVDDYVFFWEQYDQDGVIELIIYVPAAAGGDDEKVAVDCDATPGYLGCACDNGVLRTGCGIVYADGGDWVTLYVDDSYIGCLILGHATAKKVAVDSEATADYLGDHCGNGVLQVDETICYTDCGNYILLSVPGTKMVATCSGASAGYLEDVLIGDGTWITITNSGGVMTVNNIGPGASAYSGGCADGCAIWPIFLDFDCIGNMRCIHMGNADGAHQCFGPCA